MDLEISYRSSFFPKPLLLVLAALLVVILISHNRLQTTRAESLSSDDPRLLAALTHLSEISSVSHILSRGKVERTWLKREGTHYSVFIGVTSPEQFKWLLSVRFDLQGRVVSDSVEPWTQQMVPEFLLGLLYTLVLAVIVLFKIMPYVAGIKCPDCIGPLFLPTLTRAHDQTVYGGGFDRQGHSLPPIIRRSFVCPGCGYKKITHRIPEGYRGTVLDTRFLDTRAWSSHGLPVPLLERVEQLLEDYEKRDAEQLRFPTYDDWKRYFDGLRAEDREEHSAP